MRVGILTFHHGENYGAVLQSYALASAITELGHSAEIIDYRPAKARRFYNRFGVRSGRAISMLRRRWRFSQFRRQHLPLSRRRYFTSGALEAHPPDVDCLIAGSDQIWNVTSYRGFDGPFFLDFAREMDVVRSSYAATFGGATLCASERQRVGELLKSFNFISVRDLHSQEIVNELVGYCPPRVLDPSMLANFDSITPAPLRRGPYVAVYCMEGGTAFQRVADAVRRRLGMPLVCVGTAMLDCDKSYVSAGPREWLSIMKYSRFVVTNSFHGLCFSVINRKDFFVVPKLTGQSRIDDLLAMFDIGNRLSPSPSAIESLSSEDMHVDFAALDRRLNSEREKSLAYLCTVLENRQAGCPG